MSQSVRREWEARPLQERGEVILRAADLITGKYRMDLMAATMLGQVRYCQCYDTLNITLHGRFEIVCLHGNELQIHELV